MASSTCRPIAKWRGTRSAPDFALVLEGEVWALMEQSEVLLKRGNVLVQRATNHTWSNHDDKVGGVYAVMVGALPLKKDL